MPSHHSDALKGMVKCKKEFSLAGQITQMAFPNIVVKGGNNQHIADRAGHSYQINPFDRAFEKQFRATGLKLLAVHHDYAEAHNQGNGVEYDR